ncbi:MAG: hypothetical protein ABSE16_15690 [Verrucomicrobiota bacterium]|jgi:hypothetical protein
METKSFFTAENTKMAKRLAAMANFHPFHEPGNIEHRTSNAEHRMKAEDRKRPLTPALPMNLWSEDGPLTPALPMNLGTSNIEHRMKAKSPHLTLTLSPPIRVSTLTLSLSHQNGRGKRRGNSRRAQQVTWETGSVRQVQDFNARILRGILSPACHLPRASRDERNRRRDDGDFRQGLNHENYQTNLNAKFNFTNKSGPTPCVWAPVG